MEKTKVCSLFMLFLAVLFLPVWAFADTVMVSKISGDIPLNPAWKGWDTVSATTVNLFPQKIAKPYSLNPSIKKVTVRAVHNGKNIAFLLVWQDQTMDSFMREGSFSDGCAIQLPVTKDPTVPFFMGEPGKPVMLLYWKAIFNEGIVDLPKIYPNVNYDWYPEGDKGFKTKKGWAHGKRYLAGYAADNPVSAPNNPNGAEELIAEGFGTLTTASSQNTKAKTLRSGDTWKVIFMRPFNSQGEKNPNWGPGATTLVNFAVWDGGSKERGSRKGIGKDWLILQISK